MTVDGIRRRTGAALLAWVVCAGAASAATLSLLDTRGSGVAVLLRDGATTRVLVDADVTVHRPNGIRCIRAPCPSDSKTWTSRTDHAGRILIPRDMIRMATTVRVGSNSAELVEGAKLAKNRSWVLTLRPDPVPRSN